jgi:hypothetical protein
VLLLLHLSTQQHALRFALAMPQASSQALKPKPTANRSLM